MSRDDLERQGTVAWVLTVLSALPPSMPVCVLFDDETREGVVQGVRVTGGVVEFIVG